MHWTSRSNRAARSGDRYWLRSPVLPTLPAFDALVRGGGGPSRNIVITFGVVKLEWRGYPTVEKKSEDTITRFDRIHERDIRTDRRTY